MQKRKQKEKKQETMESIDLHDLSIKNLLKDVEHFSSKHMQWKERKALENKKVVSLGGQPPKKQRLPLSVARVQMKKQKERELKMLEQNMILDRFGGRSGGSGMKAAERRRKPEERVLKATEGNFRNGVLDVRHLLRPGPSRDSNRSNDFSKGGKKKNKKKGQKKGGKRKSK